MATPNPHQADRKGSALHFIHHRCAKCNPRLTARDRPGCFMMLRAWLVQQVQYLLFLAPLAREQEEVLFSRR